MCEWLKRSEKMLTEEHVILDIKTLVRHVGVWLMQQ